jgi:molybdopterin converting factor small subunit
MALVHIPTPLRPYTANQSSVRVSGATVGEVIDALVREHEGLGHHLRDDQGRLRSFVHVYLGDEDVRFLQKDATPVPEDGELTIVPSIAGGWA